MGRNLKRLERVAAPLWRRRCEAGRGGVVANFRERNRYWECNAVTFDSSHGSSSQSFYAHMGERDKLGGREYFKTDSVALSYAQVNVCGCASFVNLSPNIGLFRANQGGGLC